MAFPGRGQGLFAGANSALNNPATLACFSACFSGERIKPAFMREAVIYRRFPGVSPTYAYNDYDHVEAGYDCTG